MDPQLKAAFGHSGMFADEFESAAAEQQMDRIEAFLGLLVRAAINGQLKLGERAGFRIGKVTLAADASLKQVFKTVQAKISEICERTFEKRSIQEPSG